MARKPARSSQPKTTPRPVLQWTVAALGGLVTLAVIGVVIWEALQPEVPPSLAVRIVEIEQTPTGQVARVEVRNDGQNTAAAVEIEGQVGQEAAAATVDYVPGHGTAEAYLRFDADPSEAALRVKGWSAP